MREMSVTEQRYTSALAPSTGFEPRDVLEMPHFLIGTIQQIEADLKLGRERYGFSAVIIPATPPSSWRRSWSASPGIRGLR